ncbi:MAG: hypothetical protein IH845_00790 [Nanoarchaeota archaeon]|nr:hypothetical protein [Nanoarchaeota archaeon]
MGLRYILNGLGVAVIIGTSFQANARDIASEVNNTSTTSLIDILEDRGNCGGGINFKTSTKSERIEKLFREGGSTGLSFGFNCYNIDTSVNTTYPLKNNFNLDKAHIEIGYSKSFEDLSARLGITSVIKRFGEDDHLIEGNVLFSGLSYFDLKFGLKQSLVKKSTEFGMEVRRKFKIGKYFGFKWSYRPSFEIGCSFEEGENGCPMNYTPKLRLKGKRGDLFVKLTGLHKFYDGKKEDTDKLSISLGYVFKLD